ncbi:MAG: response regulator [Sphingomonadaceae bacterium]
MAGRDKLVLVVDDDVELQGMVQTLLNGAGYRVATATDGGQALEKVEQEMPNLILLDMKMPGMDGWKFAREFRARHNRSVPIVVVTAAEDARKRAEEVGAEGHLGKPFEIDELLHLVEQSLGART